MQLDRTPKVVKRGEFLIGGCGGSRLADLMRFVFKPPRITAKTGLEAYMVRRFAVEMKKCFETHGYGKEGDENGELYDGMVMVGVRGCLFEIDAAFSVTRSRDGFGALGSGAEVALGVLHVTGHLKPRERLLAALEVSAKVYSSVAPPFEIISTDSAVSKADKLMMKAWEGMHAGKRRAAKKGAKRGRAKEAAR